MNKLFPIPANVFGFTSLGVLGDGAEFVPGAVFETITTILLG